MTRDKLDTLFAVSFSIACAAIAFALAFSLSG
jgi:hypothetical protein